MSLRSWVLRRLSRGTAPPVDPDEYIELETVPSYMGPMIASMLRRNGIEPRCYDALNIVTRTLTDTRVMVARRDASRASAVLREFRV